MKASYKKTKNGYQPVVVFGDKTRMTLGASYGLRKSAIQAAVTAIETIEKLSDGGEARPLICDPQNYTQDK